MKKRLLTLAMALVMCMSLLPSAAFAVDVPDEPDDENPFVDVTVNDYFYKPVLWAFDREIVAGVSETEFAPLKECTRAEIVTILWEYLYRPETIVDTVPFTDVDEDAWYYPALLWAADEGITVGIGDNLFAPDRPCSRAEAMTMLWKAIGAPEAESNEAPFADVALGDWFCPAVQWALEGSITAGVGHEDFGSMKDCLRAEIVTFLYRIPR